MLLGFLFYLNSFWIFFFTILANNRRDAFIFWICSSFVTQRFSIIYSDSQFYGRNKFLDGGFVSP